MDKEQRLELIVRALAVFQTLPITAVSAEEAVFVKNALKTLHSSLSLEAKETPAYGSNGCSEQLNTPT